MGGLEASGKISVYLFQWNWYEKWEPNETDTADGDDVRISEWNLYAEKLVVEGEQSSI